MTSPRPPKPVQSPPDDTNRGAFLSARWHRALTTALEQALSRLDDTTQPPARRIRKSRQATKSARALLRLAPKRLERKALGVRMALAGVARMLAESRDADSLLETLKTVAAAAHTPRAALLALRKPLTLRRQHLAGRDSTVFADAADRLRKLTAQVTSWKLSARGDTAVLDAARRDYRKLRRLGDALQGEAEIETLHEVRRRAILHRHQLAFFARQAPTEDAAAGMTKRIIALKTLHQALGRHRDLELLDAHLRPLANPKLHLAIEGLLRTIGHMQKAELTTARRAARGVLKLKPGKMVDRLDRLMRP